jgi:AcrR family transcriptional regulator
VKGSTPVKGSTFVKESAPAKGSTPVKRSALQKKKVRKARASPAAKSKRRSREDILNRIVRAAGEEFKRYGFTGATTPAIARRASVTETQIFRYFGSKSNLFRETIFKPLDQHLLNFSNDQSAKHRKKPSRELYELYTTELQRFITEHSQMLSTLAFNQKYDAGSGYGVGEINSLNVFFEHCAADMKKVMIEKPKVSSEVMVRVTFAAVLGCVMFKDWIFLDDLASDKEITAAINTFVMEGIGANIGRNLRRRR